MEIVPTLLVTRYFLSTRTRPYLRSYQTRPVYGESEWVQKDVNVALIMKEGEGRLSGRGDDMTLRRSDPCVLINDMLFISK